MNKTKKIAIAVASLVMAGTMALGIVGCGGGGGGGSSAAKPKLDENGKLTYTDNFELKLNIGNQNKDSAQGISYLSTDLSAATVLPDGTSYSAGKLKPAWQGMSDVLKLKLTDSFQNLGSDAQISTPVENKETGNYDLISGSLAKIVEYSDSFVDLSQYLDYMPNYKAFLEANPVTKYSLTGNTSGGMFAAPYFDGNDDIEKYVLADYNLITKIFGDDYTNTNSYTWQLGQKKTHWESTTNAVKALADDTTKSYAKPFMPTTGTISVKTVPIGGSSSSTLVDAVVSYTDAHTAATTSGQALYEAINTAAGKAYTGESGNIVDLQNFAIDETEGAVTGAQLAKILKEYIKVAYKVGGTAYTKPEDVFLSVSAAWDVDLLVALSRVAICDGTDGLQFGIAARQNTTQRRTDLAAFAGELYGIRGMEARYEYAYFDKDGNLQDARADGKTYELLSNMSALTKEGIVYVGALGSDGKAPTIKKGATSGERTMMLHDYAQTQTTDGLDKEGGKPQKNDFNVAPILTPVSKWDPDGDNTVDYMRFTESWRSVKNTGFAVPKAAVEGNAEKLSAVLTLIDYIFSNDGQLLLTFGTKATGEDENATGGWWYAKNSTKALATVADKVADGYGHVPTQYKVKAAEKSNVFVYNGEVLEGMAYSDRNVPIVTKLNNEFYLGKQVTVGSTSIKQGEGNIKVKKVGDYTNYARYFIGSTLPVGNKDQGYEYQATAQCAIDGAKTVSEAIIAGAVKHVKLTLDDGESPWYLIVPTALPLIKADRDTLTGSQQSDFGKYFYNNSSTSQLFNVALDMVYYGLGTTVVAPYGDAQSPLGANYSAYTTGASLASKLGELGLTARLTIMRRGWKNLNDAYELGYVD